MTNPNRNLDLSKTDKRFICIGGTTISVEDFVNIWNGEYLLPGFSPEELLGQQRLETVNSLSGILYAIPPVLHGANTLSRLSKFLEIRGMIRRYKQGSEIRVLNMNRVLSAIRDSDGRFDQIEEFVAALPGVSPSIKDAEMVHRAVLENSQAGDVQIHYITERGGQGLAEVMVEARRQLIASILQLKADELHTMPLFFLERLAFGVAPTENDIRELSRINNIGSHEMVSAIQLIQGATFLGGFGLMFHGVVSALKDLSSSLMEIRTGAYLFTIGMYLMLLYPAKARQIAVSLASSDDRYQRIYQELAEKIEILKKSPYGRSQLALIREMAREAYSEKDLVQTLQTALSVITDPEDFNRFANKQSADYQSPGGILDLISQYQTYRSAADELE